MTVLGLALARPVALWALLVPVVFVLVLLVRARPPEVVTGTFFLWKELAGSRQAGRAARAALPPWAWCLTLALALGALALLGPRGVRARATRTWTCVVDLSPSMGLSARADGPTRLELALGAAEGWLRENAARGDRVVWRAPGRPTLELTLGTRPPAAWLECRERDGTPSWNLADESGSLWITDGAPAPAPVHAGLFASGGAAVPGVIAADGRTTVRWDGRGLVRAPGVPGLGVRVRGAPLPERLARLLGVWCEARGYALDGEARAVVLVVEALAPSPAHALRLARDGWSAAGRGGALPDPAPDEELWYATDAAPSRPEGDEQAAVVAASAGRVRLAMTELDAPSGDPAAFALSWARLWDAAVRAAPEVVSLAERQAAGAARVVPGEPPPRVDDPQSAPGATLDAGLALAAALCAGLALLLRLRL